jgi:hypothetical protein
VYDRRHRVWLAVSLVFGPGGSSLRVNRSSDGLHWGRPVTAVATSGALGQDKEWIACDNWPQSPFYGHCYLSYSDVVGEVIRDADLVERGPDVVGRDDRTGFPGPRLDPRRLRPGVQPVVLPTGRSSSRTRPGGLLVLALGTTARDLGPRSSASPPPRTGRIAACARRRCRPPP